jgi:hypothetical protein
VKQSALSRKAIFSCVANAAPFDALFYLQEPALNNINSFNMHVAQFYKAVEKNIVAVYCY